MKNRDELNYLTQGYLQGKFPSGVIATVWHANRDRTGYRVYWEGKWHDRFGQQALEEIFGVPARAKQSGEQEGYPAEPSIRALWRHLVDRYNRNDNTVKFSSHDQTK